jgi:hypothetical protein
MIVPQLVKTEFVSIWKCEPSECRSALKTSRSQLSEIDPELSVDEDPDVVVPAEGG